MNSKRWIQLLALVLSIVVLAACQPVIAEPLAQGNQQEKVMRFQVAEDGNRFVFTKERLFDDGMPQYGTPFVTQGYLYPEGTLNGTNGVLADGQPEFPDKVIGEWTCYGWMIGDGGHSTTGEWVVSTQIYKFHGENGGIIVTDGFELADLEKEATRAITSGTGAYKGISGVQTQVLHGFTEQMGVNLSVELQMD
ncbi:MAG TPA: hypothetical protein PKE45_14225 [Caldilineaceae bacterium]|nr:hypothetical protein [Caldilineaceae bacterium]